MIEIAAARWAEGEAAGIVKGKAAGIVEGAVNAKVEAILAVLAARGIWMDPDIEARIKACKDAPTLDRWILRAATAASAEEILSEAS